MTYDTPIKIEIVRRVPDTPLKHGMAGECIGEMTSVGVGETLYRVMVGGKEYSLLLDDFLPASLGREPLTEADHLYAEIAEGRAKVWHDEHKRRL